MNVQEFLKQANAGEIIRQGSDEMKFSGRMTQEALRLTQEINAHFHKPEDLNKLFSELFGEPLDKSIRIIPPFTTDFGKNIHLGKGVYINAGCRMQDQGGIYIGDGALIGHNAVFATLNHDMAPARRHDLIPSPIHLGKNVWLGANVTILSGVTIGDNAVIAAGAVVTKDVPKNAVVAGVPARLIRVLEEETGEDEMEN